MTLIEVSQALFPSHSIRPPPRNSPTLTLRVTKLISMPDLADPMTSPTGHDSTQVITGLLGLLANLPPLGDVSFLLLSIIYHPSSSSNPISPTTKCVEKVIQGCCLGKLEIAKFVGEGEWWYKYHSFLLVC